MRKLLVVVIVLLLSLCFVSPLLGAEPNALLNSIVYPGAGVQESEIHPLLQRLAMEHADYMARVCRQGHQNFQHRFDQVQRELGMTATEICAESWPWQAQDTPQDLAREMYKCWRQSRGHWAVASRKHTYAGGYLSQGRNGVWYACLLVSDGQKLTTKK